MKRNELEGVGGSGALAQKSAGPTYLVTRDVVETLERKYGYQLPENLRIDIKNLEEQFLEEFWMFVPNGIQRKAIESSQISAELDSISRRNGKPVISLDKVYLTHADEYLEVTRVTDPKTGQVKVSERPGNEPLDRQIDRLQRYPQIVLADVGAFEGGTLLEICDLLERSGIGVEEVYLGFSSNETARRINPRRLTALNSFDLYEWVELRDFFGIDGRAVGMNSGIRTYIPYWENLPEWASISQESERGVSKLCRGYNTQLTYKLLNAGCDIRRIGIPVKWEGGK